MGVYSKYPIRRQTRPDYVGSLSSGTVSTPGLETSPFGGKYYEPRLGCGWTRVLSPHSPTVHATVVPGPSVVVAFAPSVGSVSQPSRDQVAWCVVVHFASRLSSSSQHAVKNTSSSEYFSFTQIRS